MISIKAILSWLRRIEGLRIGERYRDRDDVHAPTSNRIARG